MLLVRQAGCLDGDAALVVQLEQPVRGGLIARLLHEGHGRYEFEEIILFVRGLVLQDVQGSVQGSLSHRRHGLLPCNNHNVRLVSQYCDINRHSSAWQSHTTHTPEALGPN